MHILIHIQIHMIAQASAPFPHQLTDRYKTLNPASTPASK